MTHYHRRTAWTGLACCVLALMECASGGTVPIQRAAPDAQAPDVPLQQDADSRPSRVVPYSHPRLLATAAELPGLRARFAAPENKAIADYIRMVAAYDDDGTLVDGQPDETKSFVFFGKAVLYGLEGDSDVGRAAIEMAFDYFKSLTATYAKEGLFASRAINYALQNAAFVYDWCYELFTADERSLFISEVLRVARKTEYGWPLTKSAEYFVGSHYCEDTHPTMLALGIAIYDEDPSVYDVVAPHLTDKFAPVRNFIYAGHRHHQGSAYGGSRFVWEVYSALFASRLNAPAPYVAEQGQVPYYPLYNRMPDGYSLVEGDDWLYRFPPWRVDPLVPLALSAMHQDGYLLDLATRYDTGKGDRITIFLVADEKLQPKSIEELPLSRYFGSPFGTMVARTGWDIKGGVTSAVAAARMNVKEYFFGNHDHLDAGHFSFYYKGTLALDSGSYNGGSYGSAHHRNYNQRSVAHNTILVLDPDEPRMRSYAGGPELARDGGQMWVNGSPSSPIDLSRLKQKYKRNTILAHSLGPETDAPRFSYLKGDIAGAYAAPAPYPAKVERALRSFVFINLKDKDHPAALVVYDVVRAAKAGFAKRWLLHGVAEPEVAGGVTTWLRTDEGFNGKLVNHTLLPKSGNRTISKIGGPGKQFWVEGQNYPVSANDISREAGAWRIELEPVTSVAEDRFLNVMQVADASRGPGVPGPDPLSVALIDETDVVGAAIATSVVLFSRSGELIDAAITFSTPAANDTLSLLVTDLAAGTWQITPPSGQPSTCTVTTPAHSCWFSGPAGAYQLKPL
jgi:hypothetical protein